MDYQDMLAQCYVVMAEVNYELKAWSEDIREARGEIIGRLPARTSKHAR
jgi:hypothetical protein